MQKCFMMHKDQFTDTQLYEVWDMMCDAGTEKTTFYDGACHDHHSFRDLVRAEWNDVFFVFYEGKLGMMAWVNDRVHNRAKIHFTTLPQTWGRKRDDVSAAIKLGRYFVARMLRETPLDVLVGFTPVRNKLACKYVQRVGAVPVGVAPYVAWFEDVQQGEPALITTITRESTEDEWTAY